MFESLFRDERILRRLHTSCLAQALEALADDLRRCGYVRSTIRTRLTAVEHFGRWIAQRHIDPSEVTEREVRQFIRHHLPHCRCAQPVMRRLTEVRAALNRLLKVLEVNQLNRRALERRQSAIDREVQAFDTHMAHTCGLAVGTRDHRTRVLRQFLQATFGNATIRLDRIRPVDLTTFVASVARRCTPRTAKAAGTSLRSYLRFLQFRGLPVRGLIEAVPRVPQWRLADIPQTFTDAQLQELLDVFDLSTANGCRDHAIVQCLATLGLRGEEVARLTLDDVDWRQGMVHVYSGKVRRGRCLPLPQPVGEAIAVYLRGHRPQIATRQLFVRHSSLAGRPVNVELVRSVVRRALSRANLCAPGIGVRTLRRTFATRMVQHGTSMKVVADLLGHQCIDTTTVYAKVNLPMLRTAVMPWPEAQP